ncbi:MAG: DUF134 domain-containing protein [Candidatus Neomarinimicrobiota bacterium]|jgi:predicted DNA-binding protein (UPF0251 family)|nr:DUF134 domain-containing protein [Candidatus Neomarinimicrobiota bacterium]MDD3966356.1 DUF134 domain-containing protein [Candidatus Neomarinimicrobiota bacterium]MDX9780762.1 DUF134 domain-containing protein [bacterium]
MPRPPKTRWIYGDFEAEYFKPRGRRMSEIDEISLEADELEALRLADLEELYQNDAAEKMGVSRQTFGNILKHAHQKIADALIHGKAIRMFPPSGGQQHCHRCGQPWSETIQGPAADECPECARDRHGYGHGHGRGKRIK